MSRRRIRMSFDGCMGHIDRPWFRFEHAGEPYEVWRTGSGLHLQLRHARLGFLSRARWHNSHYLVLSTGHDRAIWEAFLQAVISSGRRIDVTDTDFEAAYGGNYSVNAIRRDVWVQLPAPETGRPSITVRCGVCVSPHQVHMSRWRRP